ncbi:MAG: bifunctional DNA-formamidopyrimidine glycosylase/DNA-(apurinic or apyrimidinic site) lyase [Patescibacteria group bacterium]
MPELPEVETIRRDLETKIIGHEISAVIILDDKIVQNRPRDFVKKLLNNKFIVAERRGKLLALGLATGEYLLIHLKMTGQLIYQSHDKIIAGGHSWPRAEDNFSERFTRVKIELSGGREIRFNDMRRFGYLKVVSAAEKEKIFQNNFGIEPLTPDFTWDNFSGLFAKRAIGIKSFLLNQKIISGLGNIYADEVCFHAGVAPTRRVDKLSERERKKLFRCIPSVLALAIKNRGTTFNSFVDADGKKGGFSGFLKVYGREGEKCPGCPGVIRKIRAAGRGTHYCPDCQS